MELHELDRFSHTLQTVAIASLVFAACLLLPKINHSAQLARLPTFGGGSGEKQRQLYLQSAKHMYRDGYNKFKDHVYRIASADGEDTIVIAPRFLPELRKLPDSVLSFPKAIEKSMEVKYTQILTDEPLITHSVKADLTPALARLNPIICAEVDASMREEMPLCKDWTAVPIYMKLVNIVAKVSGRIFVGPDLCKDPKYLDGAVNYTMDLINAQKAVKHMRPWLRPFLAPRLPEVRELRQKEKEATEYLRPIVQERQERAKNDPNWQRPDDMLQWFMNRSDDYGIDSTAKLAKLQLGIIFAAIHTTTLTATNILYNLAVSPEYIGPLREEIRNAIAENDGVITSRALQQMVKLDSYMKETVRFYPPGFTTFGRKVLKGVTLSNGQYIPPGVCIEVPSHAIYQDDENYPNSDEFDGFRHYKLRQGGTATDHARNQFVTTNEQNLSFGYGKHACPGRFFAANEIKMILARAILEYDMKNADGETERYANIEMGKQTSPDPRKVLMFKKVEV